MSVKSNSNFNKAVHAEAEDQEKGQIHQHTEALKALAARANPSGTPAAQKTQPLAPSQPHVPAQPRLGTNSPAFGGGAGQQNVNNISKAFAAGGTVTAQQGATGGVDGSSPTSVPSNNFTGTAPGQESQPISAPVSAPSNSFGGGGMNYTPETAPGNVTNRNAPSNSFGGGGISADDLRKALRSYAQGGTVPAPVPMPPPGVAKPPVAMPQMTAPGAPRGMPVPQQQAALAPRRAPDPYPGLAAALAAARAKQAIKR